VTKTLQIDLSDPRVRAMLDTTGGLPGGHRSVVQLAGDAPDPMGVYRGLQSTTSLTAAKHEVLVIYKDMFLTADVYALPGEPITVHLICPRCHKPLQITGDRKRIEYDPSDRRVMDAALASGRPEVAALAESGALSIEAFECTWETGDDAHVRGIVQSGTSLCRLRIGIERNRAKDA
jgi:hypothetical protein